MASKPSTRATALALMFTREQCDIYNAVWSGSSQADVARAQGITRQAVSQLMKRATAIMDEAPEPTGEIAAGELPHVEAVACAMAGYTTLAEVVEALRSNTIPRWWPAAVTLALCRRADVPVPGRASVKVAGLLFDADKHMQRAREALTGATAAVRDLQREETDTLLKAATP